MSLNNIGLFTFTNTITQMPPGAMSAANNVVIDRPGVVETRRGFKQFGSVLSGTIHKMFAFQNRLIVHHGSTLSYDSTGSGGWIDYSGTFVSISGDRIRGVEANKNFYLTTNNGIYKIDTLTNSPYAAGGVSALDTTVSVDATGTGFLTTGFNCAYRITWVYTDANSNLIEGTPSASVTATNNSGSSQNVDVTFTIPSVVTTSYSYRIYRTVQSVIAVPPGDTFQLAASGNPTAGQIAAKSVTVTDVTPDSLLGLLLYISPGAKGEFQTNDPPPLAEDICTFQGMTFYFNCSTLQQFFVTLISVGAPNGIQNGDTISLVGTSTLTYTGAAANNYAAQQFGVITGGSIGSNIDATARNLVGAINQDTTNTQFYAYYVSGFNQLPGQILIQARNLSQGTFTSVSSRGGAFSPTIPASGITYISSNNTILNGVYVSKSNQPEAVPVTNLIFIGSGDQAIYRGYALRDAVIVQSAGGVFRITGNSPTSLTVTPFDNTIVQFGNDTGVTLNNSVYSYATQGIISVTESGSQIMSRNVEGDILKLSAPSVYANFLSIAEGISYESDRKYILLMGAQPTDTVSTIQYVYNWVTQAFSTWDKSITCGIVNPFDNLLYLAGSDGQVRQERKSFTLTDYVDDEFSVTINSINGKIITLSSVSNAVIGYTLAQGVTSGTVPLQSVITAIDTVGITVTVADLVSWSGGAAKIYQPINSTVTYTPITCGYPTFLKRFQPLLQFVFSQATFTDATIGFSTDLFPTVENVTISPKLIGGWGTFPWGTLPWGSSSAPLQMIPANLTKNTFMGHWLNISMTVDQAFQNMASDGLTGFFDLIGGRNR